jgi:hypothetical protein
VGKGLGNPKLRHLARMISATKSQVTFISETKNSRLTAAQISAHFDMHDSLVVPARGRAGGLWMMWSDDMDVTIQHTSFHLVLAVVKDKPKNLEFGIICIYGDPYHQNSSTIWQQIANFVYYNNGLPMLCIGDMNDLLFDADKSSPNINHNHMASFRSAIKLCGLFDLGYSGPAYTWTNRRFASKPIFQRLDRCLVNHEWCMNYPTSNVFNMPLLPCFSDHAPILLSTNGKMRKPRRTFKFENWWLKEEDFRDFSKACWTQNPNMPFVNKMSHLASRLKVWGRKKKPL